jgi:hypothetical protein
VLKKEKKKRKITTWIKLSFFPCTRLLVKLSFSIASTQRMGVAYPRKAMQINDTPSCNHFSSYMIFERSTGIFLPCILDD